MLNVLSASNTLDQRRRDFLVNKLWLNSIETNITFEEKKDEIDEVFMQLLHVEPPIDMVARIMKAVSQIPRPQPLSQWKDYDFFMTAYDADQLQ